ncbi:MAG: hypothetical protein Q8M02_03360 [Candidatus Didemnitutus sp.]|nr:hypothetical protein [Candidatus Didemnitutus sp.]
MNKFYLIVPFVLLGAFVFFYKGALQEMDARDQIKQQQLAAVQAAEDVRRAELERRASEDARKRQEERDAQERAKEEKKLREYQDIMTQLAKETDGFLADSDALQRDINALELQLSEMRALKETTNRETFQIAKEVELAKINRRNAELEIQRMVDMVAQRLGASSLAQMPPPPAPKK